MTSCSIIIPFHNTDTCDRRSLLDDLLETIPDREGLEVLLVDDHSTLEWSPRRRFGKTAVIALCAKPEERFAGRARNYALSMASGDWVLFADSDDLLVPWELTRFLDALGSEAVAEVVIGRAISFDHRNRPAWRHLDLEKRRQTWQSGQGCAFARLHAPWARAFRRAFLAKNRIAFSAAPFMEDVTFGASVAAARPRITLSDRAFYAVRDDAGGLSTVRGREAVLKSVEIEGEAQDILRQAGLDDCVVPLHRFLRPIFRTYPLTALRAAARALWRGQRILPRPKVFFTRANAIFRKRAR